MSMFSEKPAETKLLLTLLTFGVTIGGSFGVCWLTGSDPWGECLSETHARSLTLIEIPLLLVQKYCVCFVVEER